MADISAITALDGTTYNIKDATARANAGVTSVNGATGAVSLSYGDVDIYVVSAAPTSASADGLYFVI